MLVEHVFQKAKLIHMILFHDTISFYCQERLTDDDAEVKKYYGYKKIMT